MITPRDTCEILMNEVERLLSEGEVRAARIIFGRVCETCMGDSTPCPYPSCKVALARVSARLQAATS